MSVTVSILQSYYPAVCNLRTFLTGFIQSDEPLNSCLIKNNDSKQYLTLLDTTWVASNQQTHGNGGMRFKAIEPMISLRELIEKAQERLFIRHKGYPHNVITAGYRMTKSSANSLARGRGMAVTNQHLNTIVTALQAPEWDKLYHRIGEDAMFHLLTETSIFVALPNDCLCQMTGEPIVRLEPPKLADTCQNHQVSTLTDKDGIVFRGVKRRAEDLSPSAKAQKRPKMQRPDTGQKQQRSAADIAFARSSIFYAGPHLALGTQQPVVGLPPKHILNRLHKSLNIRKSPNTPYTDPDPRKQAENVRHLSKYIFPRQYGLSSAFIVSKPETQDFKPPNYLNREAEIQEARKCKLPKRLESVLRPLDNLLWRHGKCRYRVLLSIACPSKVNAAKRTGLDSSLALEVMSECPSQLQSQARAATFNMSTDPEGHSVANHSVTSQGFSQTHRHANNEPRFAEFACNHYEVYRYVTLVTDAIIPLELWGSKKNRKVVFDHLKDFIAARRYETTTLHNVIQGFCIMDCDWLAPSSEAAQSQSRVCVTDANKRRQLLEEFLFWYFDGFVMQLLRTTFFVTETSAFHLRVFYFRQDDWATLCAPLIDKLSSGTFEKIEQDDAQELLSQRKLGFAKTRFLPKETGARLIANMQTRKTIEIDSFKFEQSINQILQAAFQILTLEKERQPHLLGASVFSSNDVYSKLKAYKLRLLGSGSSKPHPKFYFVKVDVQACFDTIEQTKLLKILLKLLTEDYYIIQRFGQVHRRSPENRRKFVKKAYPEDDHPHFLTFAAELAAALRHIIFVDQVVYPQPEKEDIIALLEEHIAENIVRIGNDYYRQTVGIAQGSAVSTLLCCFLYGDLERRRMSFAKDPRNLLLRWIDDYLFITTDLNKAREFLSMMMKGHPDYGCFISRDKTLTNFEYDPTLNTIKPKQRCFPWCGYMIDMDDLSVLIDHTRHHKKNLRDTLTVEKGRRPGVAFARKMTQLVKARTHILFYDHTLNSFRTVYLNIYQNFLFAAMKMHLYLREWGIDIERSTSFINKIVQQIIKCAHVSMRHKATQQLAITNAGRFNVGRNEVIWLGNHAFHTVLSRKPRVYPQLLRCFELELYRPRNHAFEEHFREVWEEGLFTLQLRS